MAQPSAGTTPIRRQLTRDEAAMAARPLWDADEAVDVWSWIRQPSWAADAACREHPEVNFYPERGESLTPARAVCARCLVRDECLIEALETPAHEDHGVWGGTSAKERREMRRSRFAA